MKDVVDSADGPAYVRRMENRATADGLTDRVFAMFSECEQLLEEIRAARQALLPPDRPTLTVFATRIAGLWRARAV